MVTSRWNNLAPGLTSKFNLAADCFALAVGAAAATGHAAGSSGYAPVIVAGAAIVGWIAAARALRQYDIWKKQGIVGDLALTSVLILGVATELLLLRWLLPARHLSDFALGLFLQIVWPVALSLRLFVGVVRATRHP